MVGCKGVTLVFGVGVIVLVVNVLGCYGVLSSYIMVVCLGLGAIYLLARTLWKSFKRKPDASFLSGFKLGVSGSIVTVFALLSLDVKVLECSNAGCCLLRC